MIASCAVFARADAKSPVPTVAGFAIGLAGLAFVGTGLWGRREVRRALARERILHPALPEGRAAVTTAARAKSLAEFIRQGTVAATDGRTYAEIEPYLGADGVPTTDAAGAARDERTGQPVANPDATLWIQSTTLQTALMQAYIASRMSESTAMLGAVLVAVGAAELSAYRRG